MVSSRELSAGPAGPREGACDRTGLCDLIRACATQALSLVSARPAGACLSWLVPERKGAIDPQGRLLGDREFPTFRHVAEALGWGRRRKLHGMQVLMSDRMGYAAGLS